MIPARAIHVRHPLAAKAAEILGIDFADAVTGFEFKGRQGTAVVNGAVVSAQHRVAMIAVIVGLHSQATDEIEAERSQIVLAVWKKWTRALQIRDRLEQEYGVDDADTKMKLDHYDSDEGSTYHDDEDDGGGFMPERPQIGNETPSRVVPIERAGNKLVLPPLPPLPTYHEIMVVDSPHELPTLISKRDSIPRIAEKKSAGAAGGFVHEDEQDPTSPIGVTTIEEPGGFLPELDEDDTGGGGFLPEPDEDDTGGGGFLVDSDGDNSINIETPMAERSANIEKPRQQSVVISTEPNPNTASEQVQPPSQPQNPLPVSAREPGQEPAQEPPPSSQPFQPSHPSSQASHASQPSNPDSNHDSLVGSNTSMLSHDPEEEEAEPEWLLDSLA
jgi:xeroderma pigmentosum group C-complementing protein